MGTKLGYGVIYIYIYIYIHTCTHFTYIYSTINNYIYLSLSLYIYIYIYIGVTLIELMQGLETDRVTEQLWLGTVGDAFCLPFLRLNDILCSNIRLHYDVIYYAYYTTLYSIIL